MRRLLLLLCALVPCACKAPAEATPGPRAVYRVVLEKTSGPVAVPWSEQYTISRTGIEFQRTGDPGSGVNAGTWVLAEFPAVTELFERLGSVDCAGIKVILPEDGPDGGGTTSYLVEYEDGSTCSVWFREGITYAGAEELVEAIRGFVGSLTLPAGASGLFPSP